MNKDIGKRAVIRLGGETATGFLNGITANDVSGATTQGAVFTALLTPQGKIQYEFFVFSDGANLLLDAAVETAEALAARLKMYRLRAKVTIEPAPDLTVLTGRKTIPGGTVAQSADPRHAALGFRAIVASESAVVDDAYNARRIEAGVPELGRDFAADEVFLMDVNYDLLNGVNYAKGCFVGQEVTSRMKRKSAPRKRTLIIASSDDVSPGDDVMSGNVRLGAVTSAEGVSGLALIRIDRLQTATAPVTVGAAEATLRMPEYLQG